MGVSRLLGTDQSQALPLQVSPQGSGPLWLSISILSLLPWFKCILVITSLITAKAICIHPPAKTGLLPCRDSCSSAQRKRWVTNTTVSSGSS